jgi:hypothetical protein
MKKIYEIPTLYISPINQGDVIRTSSQISDPADDRKYNGEWDDEM